MLYDILPPLIFFASLGGVVGILARVGLRQQRQMVATMVAQAREAATASPEHILRPTQKSVQAIGSRLAAVLAFMRQVPGRAAPYARRTFGALRSIRLPKLPKIRRPVKLTSAPQPAAAVSPKPKITITTREVPAPAAPVPRSRPPLSVLAQANAAIAATQYQQAEELLVSYIVNHTKDVRAYMLLGRAAAGKKNWPEAVEIFEQVTRLDSQEPAAWAALGEAAFACGKFTKALEALQRAHNADRENVTVLRHLLTIAQRMDNRVLLASVQQELAVLEGEQTPAK